jgi:RHS repeat-associated protein
MDNTYSYDKENNILGLANTAPVPASSLMGGSSQYSYTYDDLYRLTTASGTFTGPHEQDRYSMTMEYNTVGSLMRKTQTNDKNPNGNKWIPQKKTTYDQAYTYDAKQPHAATHIGRQTYSYDADGNQTGWTDDKTGQRQKMVWDEENRLRSVSVNGELNSYVYDATGERVLKGLGAGQTVYVNGDITGSSGGVGNFTVYVNPYLVVKSGEYSNHYFIESQRIATRLEHGWDQQVSAPDAGDSIPFTKKERALVLGISRDQQALQGSDSAAAHVTGADARGVAAGGGTTSTGSGTPWANANPDNNGNHYAYGRYKKSGGTGTAINPDFLYFYHVDHLGSTSYVTDGSGQVYQHLEYFAFGETFVEEHSNTERVPYLFNGKELDEETGLYYYGARYYDPRTSIWQSVDPLAARMPAWSPYAMNYDNPVKFIDLKGEKPTPAEAARMAAHVYGDKKDNILIGGWQVSKRDFGIKLQDETGLKSMVYERVVNGKVTEYCYATAGTELNWKDVGADVKQPLGLSKQYHSAASNAKEISRQLGGTELTFTGHSLGGGEAALEALVTDRSAITFNAAGVSNITKFEEGTWKTPFKSEKKIDAYIMSTDPLNKVQNNAIVLPEVNGNRHTVKPTDFSSYYNGHSMDNMLKSMGLKNPGDYNLKQ